MVLGMLFNLRVIYGSRYNLREKDIFFSSLKHTGGAGWGRDKGE
jgi:membrane protein CcdC involved in cytochrome C biogenesis